MRNHILIIYALTTGTSRLYILVATKDQIKAIANSQYVYPSTYEQYTSSDSNHMKFRFRPIRPCSVRRGRKGLGAIRDRGEAARSTRDAISVHIRVYRRAPRPREQQRSSSICCCSWTCGQRSGLARGRSVRGVRHRQSRESSAECDGETAAEGTKRSQILCARGGSRAAPLLALLCWDGPTQTLSVPVRPHKAG